MLTPSIKIDSLQTTTKTSRNLTENGGDSQAKFFTVTRNVVVFH